MSSKSKPLFTPAEEKAFRQKMSAAESRRNGRTWESSWAERKALEKAHQQETAKRVEARPNEFLDALLVLVGNRGAKYVVFSNAFANSDSQEIRSEVRRCNTPENRRVLYTILRALGEIPKTWAMSAFVRFLRGTGKQKGAKYHGAGTLGAGFGWKESEVANVCRVIADGQNPYSLVLMSYAEAKEEVREESEVEIVNANAEFAATRVERNTELLENLCRLLERRGLGDIPAPPAQKPKKPRKPKVFRSGDVIRGSNLRDLPLPAHIRVPIEKSKDGKEPWLADSVEQVVTAVVPGFCTCMRIGPDGKAYASNRFRSQEYKSWVFGATYLGQWRGEMVSNKELKYKFSLRKPSPKSKAGS